MTDTRPVQHWDTDFDIMSPAYVADPFSIWDELRKTCPVAHTDRRGSTWLPTRYQDVVDLAHDVEHFSSAEITVIPFEGEVPEDPVLPYGVPPISADPPLHTWTRRLLLPWFSHRRVESYEATTRELCSELVDGFIERGTADAAGDYAQQIPVRVIAGILGVPAELSDTFTGWVRDVLEFADDPELRLRGMEGLITFFVEEVDRRKTQPGEDLLSYLLHSEVDGVPVEESVVLGVAALVLIAGVDTTWSAIGSSLWHLATHPEDRDRLVAEPDA
ncbi:MAG TPA: cytochrome P450, partial [Acidimicrobiales bacterium]